MAEAKVVKVDLPDEIFDAQSSVPLMHQVVVAQLAAARQGTHKVKTRAEVSGSGRKPFKQKGTGNARQGSIRAPHMTGGGVVHGPVPRDYSQRTPKKMKAAALRGALSDRARHGRITVVESLVSSEVPKTKEALQAILSVTERRNVLVVADSADSTTIRSVRNIENVHALYSGQLNTYDVLAAEDIIFTRLAFEEFVAAAPKVKPKIRENKDTKVSKEKSPKVSAGSKPVKTSKEEPEEPKKFKGSKAPLKDPSRAPKGYEIKALHSSKAYYVPDSEGYVSMVADLWFNTTENAEAAGFNVANGNSAVTDEKGKA